MVIVDFEPLFEKSVKKIKNNSLKIQVKKQIKKIITSPIMGKPMRYSKKGTREVYVNPFRLSYTYIEQENKIVFLNFYHKDEQ